MRYDAAGDEHLAALVPIQSPRVAGAGANGFQFFRHRVIAPHAAVDEHARAFRRAGRADVRARGDAVAAVKPAVGAPVQIADDVVHTSVRPAIEYDLRLAAGLGRIGVE